MKLVRFSENSHPFPKPGMVDAQGGIRDLSSLLEEIEPSLVMRELENLKKISPETFPLVPEYHLLCPITRPGKLIGIAFNSKVHTQEMGREMPEELVFFLKATSALAGPYDPILYPKVGQKLDWEGELGVVIGQSGKYIDPYHALDYVLGYVCHNDLSDRHWQLEHGGNQHTKGKSFDTFAPIGPYLVTKESVDPENLHVTLKVNGVLRQNFSTKEYLRSISEVIAYLSQLFTLEAGDVISMGSGPGNAKAHQGQYLQVGDLVEFEIESLGTQVKRVVAEK